LLTQENAKGQPDIRRWGKKTDTTVIAKKKANVQTTWGFVGWAKKPPPTPPQKWRVDKLKAGVTLGKKNWRRSEKDHRVGEEVTRTTIRANVGE